MKIENFFIDGFVVTEDRSIADLIPEFKLPASNDFAMIDVDLQKATDYVGAKYIKPFFNGYQRDRYSMFVGSEPTTTEWHNDLVEGYNIFFLYYLTTVDINGELMVKCNDTEVGSIRPQKHTLVMLSQAPHILHKVNPTDQVRVAINFGYQVDGLNY